MILKKIVMFLFLLFGFISLIKFIDYSDNSEQKKFYVNALKELKSAPDSSVYFIGSSRIQRSVNPYLLNEKIDSTKFYNVGLSGCTFMGNISVADYLLKTKSPKVIYIELSSILQYYSKSVLEFSSLGKIELVNGSLESTLHNRILNIFDRLNNDIIKSIKLANSVKGLIDYTPVKKGISLVGFIKGEDTFFSTDSFLKYTEIDKVGKENLEQHKKVINYLINFAEAKNSKIIFMLPITYRKSDKKSLAIQLYNYLPSHMKLQYSKEFLEDISHAKYLNDENHLNGDGANKYTSLIIPLIKKHLN